MAQTRMFRDRMVSLEQTLEGGERHLALLKELCREALPGFEYQGHALDHERDLFVMELRGADGATKRVGWTRMVLFDAERVPTLTGDPAAALRGKIIEFLKSRAARPEIVVTFRHLEEGWVDTPEPRREGGRRRRRGGRGGGRGVERDASEKRAQGAAAPGQAPPRPPVPPRPAGTSQAAVRGAEAPAAPAPGGKRRRRFRRRRRGRGSGADGGSAPAGPAPSGPRA